MLKGKAAVLVLAGIVGLCGCSQEDTGKETAVSETAQELVIWSYYETMAQKEGMDKLIRDFNQSQKEYRISWEYVPMTGFNKGLSSAYTEDALPDMAILDNPDMPTLVQLGLFEDITTQVEKWNLREEFYSSIVDTCEYEGRYYGVPFNCNSTALIYDKQALFEEHVEPPTSWEELRKVAKTLTTKERSGFAMCCMEGEQGAFQILPWILAAGEEPENLGGEATAEAFRFLETLLRDGSLSENCINLTQTDLAREFIEGKSAIIQNGPWVFPMLDEVGMDYGILPIPGKKSGTAVLGGENIGILKGKNVEGSVKFLEFCMEGEEITDFCRSTGVLPGRMEAARELVKENEKLQIFEKQMDTVVTRPSIPQWSSVSKRLTEGMYLLVAKEAGPEEIAKTFQIH